MVKHKNPFQWLINIWINVWTVTVTLLRDIPRVWELARFEFTLQYRDSHLGLVWAILSPLTQIGVYWFTFGIGLRHGSPMGEYPFIVWLVCGMTAWNHLSKGILGGAGELRAKQSLISKVSIPPYLLLVSQEVAFLMDQIMRLLIMFLLMVANGWRPDRYALNLCYYIFCSLCFCVASSTVFSVLTLIAADFRRLLESGRGASPLVSCAASDQSVQLYYNGVSQFPAFSPEFLAAFQRNRYFLGGDNLVLSDRLPVAKQGTQ